MSVKIYGGLDNKTTIIPTPKNAPMVLKPAKEMRKTAWEIYSKLDTDSLNIIISRIEQASNRGLFSIVFHKTDIIFNTSIMSELFEQGYDVTINDDFVDISW